MLVEDMIELFHLQALHQWRMVWDGDYRLWYYEWLEELDFSLTDQKEEAIMVIPMTTAEDDY